MPFSTCSISKAIIVVITMKFMQEQGLAGNRPSENIYFMFTNYILTI